MRVDESAASAASSDYSKFQAGSSRDQVGFERSLEEAQNPGERVSAPRPSPASRASVQALPWNLGPLEAGLAADLIMA